MIVSVFFFPNGMVAAFAAPQSYRKNKMHKGKKIVKTVSVESRQVPMLQGYYSQVKFKLIPAINSCQPELHGTPQALQQLERDMRRFCVIRSKKRSEQKIEEDAATASASEVVPETPSAT